ncbi:uncharacterized protein [Rutidosis leptorrhynchoides]|uniref:uncharacterized protein n=1 Tax=Rutidosis leptorrhynchoides TaxID=125765 RepID=UPI003A9A3107
MFWRMTGLSTESPVDTILDKENFTLEELLVDDEIIQECKAANSRLINFLKERAQVEQLVRYIVEEPPEDAVEGRRIKFPFIACELFTCEVDTILIALVEDEEMMNLLFSFLEPEHPHNALLAGYFSKVVVSLLLRQSASLMSYIQAHPDIIQKLVDLIGVTSIMEVLIRLIGADEYLHASYEDSMQWLEDIDVLEMIVNKFSSSDSPEVHANAAETLCAIVRYAPPVLSAKISSQSFIARLFHHALEDSRPRSVLVNSLTVCISLLDPKRQTSGSYYMYNQQMTHESSVKANPEIVEIMLESLGNLLKVLDVAADKNVLPTPYGKVHPPLGKHRLMIVEFISVLMNVRSGAAEKELIRLGVLRRILELFFEYPFNNFLHHYVEQIVVSSLESENASLVEHILEDCNLVKSIIHAERNNTINTDNNSNMPTVSAEGRMPPRIGNVGHMTRIANKLVKLMDHNSYINAHLKGNSEWVEWHANVLQERNAVENVSDWVCGRPAVLNDRAMYSDDDDDDYVDRDYDVAALANNLSQTFRYGIFENDDNNEARGSQEIDDEDMYFDDASAEAVVSSLQLGEDDEQPSTSFFVNPSWSRYELEKSVDELLSDQAPNTDITSEDGDNEFSDAATFQVPDPQTSSTNTTSVVNSADNNSKRVTDKPLEAPYSTEPFDDTVTEAAGPSKPSSDDLPTFESELEPKPEQEDDTVGKHDATSDVKDALSDGTEKDSVGSVDHEGEK